MCHPAEQSKCHSSLLIILSVMMLTAFPVGSLSASPLKVGVVGAANPSVAALNKDNIKHTLTLGKDVFFEETITTDAKGSLQLLFVDKSALTVGPNSSLKIDKFVYNPQNSSGEMTITSTKGAFRFIGGALSKNNAVKIKTPVSTIGIRGGIAMVDVNEKSGATNATFVYGKELVVENKVGDRQVTTEPGSGMSVLTPTSAPTAPVKVDIQTLTQNITQLESSDGQHGGATTVPDEKTVNDKISTSEEKSSDSSTSTSGQDSSSSSSEKDSKDSSSDSKDSSSADSSSSGQDSASTTSTESSSASADSGGLQPVAANAPVTEAVVFNSSDTITQPAPVVTFVPTVVTSVASTITETKSDDSVTAIQEEKRKKEENEEETKTETPTTVTGTTVSTTETRATDTEVKTETNEKTATTTATTTTVRTAAAPASANIPVASHHGHYVIKSGGTNLSGTVAAYHSAGVFYATFMQTAPTTGTATAYTVPRRLGAGYQAFDTTVATNGSYYNGHSFGSVNDKMTYYQFTKVDDSQQLAVVLGERISRSALPTTGTSVYEFLPDLHILHSNTQKDFGFFDYNIADSRLLPAGVVVANIPSGKGMIVDWATGTYLTGYMNWEYTSDTNYKHSMKLAAGKINRTGTDPELKGYVMDVNGYKTSTTVQATKVIKGYSRINENIYGNAATNNIDGFIFEAIRPDSPVTSGDAFDLTVAGTRTVQPMMQKTATTAGLTEALANRHEGTFKGFMAGFVKKDVNGSPSYGRYYNSTPSAVVITKNTTTNSIGATISLSAIDGGASIYGQFGADAASGPLGVFISDKIYAMEQGSLTYNGTAANRADGVMVGNYISSNADLQCTTCTYVDWGVWAAEIQADSSNNVVDIAHMIPYVTGTVTENIGAINSGDATYNGKIIGNVLNTTTNVLTHQNGTFWATVTLSATPTISHFHASFAGREFGAVTTSVATGTNTAATFTSAITAHDGPTTLNGTMNGAFFGPAAQDIGGNFKYNTINANSEVIKGSGVFLGSK